MCGIAGLVRGAGGIEPEPVATCSRLLVHRGPDDHGYLGWDGAGAARVGQEPEITAGARVALIHRRLAILDLSPAGRQPMSTSDGHLHIVYNGEIYNYLELRRELEAEGVTFSTRSDTEVLLAALASWGTAALPRLVGMFALALLDTRAGTLTLARDFFGIKPLYYRVFSGGFAFASEIGPLLALSRARPVVNPLPLYHYLRFGISDHGPETMLQGVRQLPPAHHLTIRLDRGPSGDPARYWSPTPEHTSELGFGEAADRLRELFCDSVRLHLRSDVPVGAALSGGIDSSSIVAAMRHAAGAGLDLHTVSFVADDPELSEARWIDLAAQAVDAHQHRVAPDAAELAGDLERLIEAQYEPCASTSMWAQYRVFSAAARAGLKVMIDGQGADELLGGYRFYLAGRLLSLVRQGRWLQARRLWRNALQLPGVARRDLFSWLGFHLVPRALHRAARTACGRPLLPAWLNRRWFEGCDLDASPVHRSTSHHALREMLLATVERTSLPMLLRFEDRNSMALSVESRVPFLTPRLAEFILALPEEHIVAADGTSKSVFRAAMRGLVPEAILDRRDKIGFATPELRWLGELRPWVERILASETMGAIPALVPEAVAEEWHGILAGRRRFDWHVWRWINLVRWSERFAVSYET